MAMYPRPRRRPWNPDPEQRQQPAPSMQMLNAGLGLEQRDPEELLAERQMPQPMGAPMGQDTTGVNKYPGGFRPSHPYHTDRWRQRDDSARIAMGEDPIYEGTEYEWRPGMNLGPWSATGAVPLVPTETELNSQTRAQRLTDGDKPFQDRWPWMRDGPMSKPADFAQQDATRAIGPHDPTRTQRDQGGELLGMFLRTILGIGGGQAGQAARTGLNRVSR